MRSEGSSWDAGLTEGCRQGTGLRFQAADATWRQALADLFGEEGLETRRYDEVGRGQPGSRLRQAYDARERAYRLWLRARGLGDFRYGCRIGDPRPAGAIVAQPRPTERGERTRQAFRVARERCALEVSSLADLADVDVALIMAIESGIGQVSPEEAGRVGRVLGLTAEGEPVQAMRALYRARQF